MHSGLAVGCQIGLIGLPDDAGVRLNGGRPGAAEGPRAFREALCTYGVHDPAGWVYPKVFDAGDVEPAGGHTESALLETHARVSEAVSGLLDLGLFPVGIGGGHDLTLAFVRAVAGRCRKMRGVYFDAHLDVRERVGSGMAFRRLVEECGAVELNIFGFNEMVNAREHVEWFEGHGGRVRGGIDELAGCLDGGDGRAVFASFDLDVIDAAHAPGVSALNPAGWTVREARRAVRECGRAASVRCMDFMELSPAHDAGGRTARVAADLFLSFLRGFSERGAP